MREAPKGGRPKNDDNLSPYSEQAATSLGVDKRTVQRDLARGKKIAPEVLAEISGTALDKGVVLDQLARAPAAQQPKLLEQLRQERSRVPLAQPPLNDAEAAERQLAALTNAWNKAAPEVRSRFLARAGARAPHYRANGEARPFRGSAASDVHSSSPAAPMASAPTCARQGRQG